jgi:hypothetical protein
MRTNPPRLWKKTKKRVSRARLGESRIQFDMNRETLDSVEFYLLEYNTT